MPHAIVVCPLTFETSRLARRLDTDSLRTIGPGAAAVTAWAASAEADQIGGGLVVLAGLAGSLVPELAAGHAHVVSLVRAPDGRTFTPSSVGAGTCTVTSSPDILTTPAAKHACRDATGADIVDLESVTFAEVATTRGWRWAIVRGISDGVDETLPASDWSSATGATRMTAVLRSLARKETTIGQLMTLRRHATAALDEVAASVIRLTEDDGVV